jgi:transposase
MISKGLFQFGPSKNRRPDLPQVEVMLAAPDMPVLRVATEVLPKQRANAPVYPPAILHVRERLGCRGLLYIGDCMMVALERHASLEAGGDFCLCPLPNLHPPP